MTWNRMIGIGPCLVASWPDLAPRFPMWHIMNIRTRTWASAWHVIQCPHERDGRCLDPLWSCFWLGWFWRRKAGIWEGGHVRLQPLGCCGRSRGDITLGDRKERLASQIELGSKPCTAKRMQKTVQPNAHVFPLENLLKPSGKTQKSSTVFEKTWSILHSCTIWISNAFGASQISLFVCIARAPYALFTKYHLVLTMKKAEALVFPFC